MTKLEKLEEVKGILKSEFVGLDDIIDTIISNITPWYVTPEIIERPVVVSLWGMTGTGKTSLIRRLTELLDYKDKTIFYDCGNSEDSNNLANRIKWEFKLDDEFKGDEITKDLLFVLDEFQYARSLNEAREEIDKSALRPIWSLMDNGILNLDTSADWDVCRVASFLDDLISFNAEYPNVELENGVIKDRDSVLKAIEVLGIFWFDNRVTNNLGNLKSNPDEGIPLEIGGDPEYNKGCEEDSSDKDPLRPLNIIPSSISRGIVSKMRLIPENTETLKDILDRLYSNKTVPELIEDLQYYKQKLMAPKNINCTKSLIFILGNLDEAFRVSEDINPDMDADVFYEETSKISVIDIKESLGRRFRPEQISRFGNSIIKYPTLKKEHFEKIIEKETTRIISKFKETTGIEILVDKSILKLLYSEGVYPVQGVRPVFTTIGTILTPILSEILLGSGKKKKLTLLTKDTDFKKATIKVECPELKYTKEISLSLGALRNPESRKTRYISSIHEIGHAIIFSYLTGELPSEIVGVSSDGGGFCTTFEKSREGEINTRRDVKNSVMIGVAGWCAEKLIFGEKDPDMVLMGSGSDLSETWEDFCTAVYELGYYNPTRYTNFRTEKGRGFATGRDDLSIRQTIKEDYDDLVEKTLKLLKDNKKLLLKAGLKLAEIGELKGSEFKDLIQDYGYTLTIERMESLKPGNNWYKDVIESLISEYGD